MGDTCFSLDGHGFKQVRIDGDKAPAVDPQGFIHVRDHEDEADVSVLEDISVAIDPPVSEPVRNRDRPRVEHAYHTGCNALG